MDIVSVYKIYVNINRSLTYLRYFNNSKSGSCINNIVSNFDTFFHKTCIKYNDYMFSTDATKVLLDMITDYHIKHIIENNEFPDDLIEDFNEHFENNWYLRVSLEPFKKLIGRSLFSKYETNLRERQKTFNIGLEVNLNTETICLSSDNEIGEFIQNNVIETILCSRIYYGNKMSDVVANAIRQRFPHILEHVYNKLFSNNSFIYNNRNRLSFYIILKKLYLDLNITAIIIQRRWRRYRLKHNSYFKNLKAADQKIINKKKRGIIEDDRISSNETYMYKISKSKKEDIYQEIQSK